MPQTAITGGNAFEIATSIETGIHGGRLNAGQALPTVRQLAVELRVSPTTIAGAYRLLRVRGLVTGRGRGGTRVTARPPSPTALERPPLPAGVVDLASGSPDPTLLPPLAQILRTLEPAPRLYDGPSMIPALAAFAASEFEADGIPADAITLVHGGLDGIERLLREYLRPGDRVAVEDPSFPGILDLIASGGFLPTPVALDVQGPVPRSLENALDARPRAIIITPRAQNPTGVAMTPARATELRRLLKKHPDVLLIEDDSCGPIAGAPAVTLADSSRARWAVVRSVSKFLGPDLRAAVMAGDQMTIARVEGRHALGARWVSHLLQQLVLALWSDPSSGRRLARAADVYRLRREALIGELTVNGIAGYGRSGLNVWIPVRDEARIVQGLLDRGWGVMPGERFRLRSRPGIRVTISTLTPDDAERFARDFDKVLRPAVGTSAWT